MPPPQLGERAAGALLHPTSLPGPYGTGDIGPAAYRFADFLSRAGLRWWQLLPVSPAGGGHSPYQTYSSFAGDPHLISLEILTQDGLLLPEDVEEKAGLNGGAQAKFEAADCFRSSRLARAFERFSHRRGRQDFNRFCEEQSSWLNDHALYCALSGQRKGAPWTDWEDELKWRRESALSKARRELAKIIRFHKWCQFEFQRQWRLLKERCAISGVGLIGDLPIFVAHDSVEVWSHPELFWLDERGRPSVVAGVPPDYFSKTGQRWGNVLYRWDKVKETGFDWWVRRLAINKDRFDVLRLDHFIGFSKYWEIPAEEKTAVNGRWMPAPGHELFEKVRDSLGTLSLIAEDLGLISHEVRELRDRFGLPGMKVLQFSFDGGPDNEHRPENTGERSVVYTGTHDNDTTVGWFESLSGEERNKVLKYLNPNGSELHWNMIRLAFDSKAQTAIVPVQDILGLGASARMNTPGTMKDNWLWRLESEDVLNPELASRIRAAVQKSNRFQP